MRSLARPAEASGILFPIPMRGNEIDEGHVVYDWIVFPIPMRGNEMGITGWPSVKLSFPIPMRGNEMEQLKGTGLRLVRFPIPMRGNELSWVGVPDPDSNDRSRSP